MDVEIEIVWDGTVPGLAEHALSLGSFGTPLGHLLAALRRIASNIVADAVGPEHGARGGRLAEQAKYLDLELTRIGKGSAVPMFNCKTRVPQGGTFPLFDDLPERAARELIASIRDESRGRLRNAPVRKFLSSLPAGLRRQKYLARRGDVVLGEIELGEIELPELPADEPYFVRVLGSIVGVGFEPGKPEVRVKGEPTSVTCPASPAQIEQALRLRGEEVEALVLQGPTPRLLWIRKAGEPFNVPSPAERIARMHERWGETLRRLAQ